jgi:hypothetical protein
MIARWSPTICPGCDRELPGLGTWCPDCNEYTDLIAATTDPSPPARDRLDTRTEAERRHDARPAVEAIGWIICDMEQGYRPDKCPECKARLPGGHSTRVRSGFADWVVMGHGLIVLLEWKSATGKPNANQKVFAGDCAVAGVPYYVVRTTTEAIEALTDARRRYA